MPAIRVATVLRGLSDGIKARVECKTGITVISFDEIKHISSNEGFMRQSNRMDNTGLEEKKSMDYFFSSSPTFLLNIFAIG